MAATPNLTKLLPAELQSVLAGNHFVAATNLAEIGRNKQRYQIVEGKVRRGPVARDRAKGGHWVNVVLLVNQSRPDGNKKTPKPHVVVCRVNLAKSGGVQPAEFQHIVNPHHVQCLPNAAESIYLADRYCEQFKRRPQPIIRSHTLNYIATERIKDLAKPRLVSNDNPPARPLAPTFNALHYLATPRIAHLSVPHGERTIKVANRRRVCPDLPAHLLHYRATARIIRLAKPHRYTTDYDTKLHCFGPVPRQVLTYVASRRICELSKAPSPQQGDYRQPEGVSPAALQYRASPHICQIAQPREVTPKWPRTAPPLPPHYVPDEVLRHRASRRTCELARSRCYGDQCPLLRPYWQRVRDVQVARQGLWQQRPESSRSLDTLGHSTKDSLWLPRYKPEKPEAKPQARPQPRPLPRPQASAPTRGAQKPVQKPAKPTTQLTRKPSVRWSRTQIIPDKPLRRPQMRKAPVSGASLQSSLSKEKTVLQPLQPSIKPSLQRMANNVRPIQRIEMVDQQQPRSRVAQNMADGGASWFNGRNFTDGRGLQRVEKLIAPKQSKQ